MSDNMDLMDDALEGAMNSFLRESRLPVIQTTPFRAGHWNGKPYEEMELSHLLNCVSFAKQRDWNQKAKEIEVYLKTREAQYLTNKIVQKNAFIITEEMLVELARSKGVKIPKSGAGAYITVNGQDHRLTVGELAVKFDVTKSVKGKK